MALRRLLLLCTTLSFGCNGPFVLLPGGQLAGDASPLPTWTSETYGTAQLETRPEDPYSVNVAYTILEGSLYVNAGDTRTQWVENMIANPQVRLRIDGKLFDAQAERVTRREEILAFGKAWTDQSMFRRDPAGLDEVWLYRFVAR